MIVSLLLKNCIKQCTRSKCIRSRRSKTQSGRDFRKEKGGYVKFDPAEAKKLLEEGMKEQGWSTLPEVTLKFTTDTQHKK